MVINLNVPAQARINDARLAWLAFQGAGIALPFVPDDVVPTTIERRCDEMRPGAYANAWVVPAVRTAHRYVRFCLTERFFGLTPPERNLVLLHELVHVRLFEGRLSANYGVISELQARLYAAERAEGFVESRTSLAADVLGLAQEIGVDRYIVQNYGALADTYAAMRLPNYYQVPTADDAEALNWPTLSIYRGFHYLVRSELGLSILQDGDERADIQRRRLELLGQIQEAPPEIFALLDGARQRLMAIRVDTDDPDADEYRDVFDLIDALVDPADDNA